MDSKLHRRLLVEIGSRNMAGAMLDQYFNMVEQILTQPGGFARSASVAPYLGPTTL
jgi:hypothetical protein